MTSRTRVLLAVPNLTGGGAQRFFSLLLQHLDRTHFEPHLVLFQAEGEYLKDVPRDVMIHDLECDRARYSFLPLIRLLRNLQPKAVLSTLPECNLVLTIVKPLLPAETTLILSEACDPNGWLRDKGWGAMFWRLLYRLFYKRADRIVCLSLSMIEEMERDFKIPKRKLTRIYYPVDVQHIQKLAAAGPDPFYNTSGPQIIAVGRLCHQKGFDVLLSAMQILRGALWDTRLAILGQGPLEKELRFLASLMGVDDIVDFYGFQTNPWRFVNYADIFVLPSRYEGLPNVLLEAMALNKPIVASDCGGGIRELQRYIPNMILVPPNDPKALAEGIIAACRKFGREGGVRPPALASVFGLDKILAEYSQLLLDQ